MSNNSPKYFPVLLILFLLCIILFSFITRTVLFVKAIPIHIHIITLFIVLVAGISGFIWRRKVPESEKREKQFSKFLKFYAIFLVLFGVIGPILLMALMIICIATGNL